MFYARSFVYQGTLVYQGVLYANLDWFVIHTSISGCAWVLNRARPQPSVDLIGKSNQGCTMNMLFFKLGGAGAGAGLLSSFVSCFFVCCEMLNGWSRLVLLEWNPCFMS